MRYGSESNRNVDAEDNLAWHPTIHIPTVGVTYHILFHYACSIPSTGCLICPNKCTSTGMVLLGRYVWVPIAFPKTNFYNTPTLLTICLLCWFYHLSFPLKFISSPSDLCLVGLLGDSLGLRGVHMS